MDEEQIRDYAMRLLVHYGHPEGQLVDPLFSDGNVLLGTQLRKCSVESLRITGIFSLLSVDTDLDGALGILEIKEHRRPNFVGQMFDRLNLRPELADFYRSTMVYDYCEGHTLLYTQGGWETELERLGRSCPDHGPASGLILPRI